jgi:hypothetical protein
MTEVKEEAKRRHIKLITLSTAEAIELLKLDSKNTNTILHVTC